MCGSFISEIFFTFFYPPHDSSSVEHSSPDSMWRVAGVSVPRNAHRHEVEIRKEESGFTIHFD